MKSVNILTFKWGTLYSAEYVNRIYRGVKAHLKRPFRFVCVTDDADGLLPEIDAEPIPPRPPEMKNLYTYEKFIEEIDQALDDRVYATEQLYMTHAIGPENISFWPDNFVRSFKRSCTWPWPLNHFLTPRFNPDTGILCFHGKPTPEQAIAGYRGRHLNTWTRPCPWVKALWETPSA